MKKITREQLRRWGACYNDGRIAELVPEAGLTPLEIVALDIPSEDRMWVLLREDIIPARELRLLACDWAEAACVKTGWADERSLNAIAVARRFACGDAAEAELAAASAEARSASQSAWSADSPAAWAAARAAAWAARAAASEAADAAASAAKASAASEAVAVAEAETASRSASRSAAWAAAWAARAAASEAAAQKQFADVVRVLKAGTNNNTPLQRGA